MDRYAMDGRRQLLELKVGAFVVVTAALGLGVVLLLGHKRQVFEERVVLHALFTDVQGLSEGAPVRLAGVNVGMVAHIDLPSDRREPRVPVDLEISRAALGRLGRDSIARIGGQGLLGDKIVELSLGSADSPPLEAGGALRTVPPADLNRLVEQAGLIFDKAKVVADNAAIAVAELADPRTIAALHGALESIRKLLRQAERGPGLAHALFYDPAEPEKLDRLLGRLDHLVAQVDDGVSHVDRVLASLDDDGVHVVNNVSRAARSLDAAAGDLHRSRVVANLERASGDLVAVTGEVRAGRGTVGALIADPTVYEQLVTVLGGVTRSRLLRALVRFAISKSDPEDRDAARHLDEKAIREAPAPAR